MNLCQTLLRLGFAVTAIAVTGQAAERNAWPALVEHVSADGTWQSWQSLGPLIFEDRNPDGSKAGGFRPFYLVRENASRSVRDITVLYPLFTYHSNRHTCRWSVLNLINWNGRGSNEAAPDTKGFDLWPFYFSRQTSDPATSYRAVFPIFGPLKNRFGQDRLDWVLFPFFARSQKGDKVVTAAPWPFWKTTEGGGHRGWALWPLAGRNEQTDVSRSWFCLWPLVYRDEMHMGKPEYARSFGVLPFYAQHRSPEVSSDVILWPFFGRTDRVAPYRYNETRWFWPFFVQGSGDDRMRERWAPFYTHSVVKGVDKTWVLWPFWRREAWNERGLAQEQTQFLFFLYRSQRQRIPGRPAAGSAQRTHLWPLCSVWDNGAGRRQVQVMSPIAPFFPNNENVRLSYAPFFALYRYDRRSPGETRSSFLWDAVTYERHDKESTREFHLGPLVSVEKKPTEERIAIAGGLLGMRRVPGQRVWRAFFCDFSRNSAKPCVSSAPAP